MFCLILAAVIGLSQAFTLTTSWTTLAPPPVPTTAPTNKPTEKTMMPSTPQYYYSTTGHSGTHQHHHQQTTKHHFGHHHTAYPTTTRPPVDTNEFDTATFYYDSMSHTMVMHLGTCYLMKLSATQQQQVHTQHGLKTVELSVMNAVAVGHKTRITHNQVVAMSVHLSHMCPNQYSVLLHHAVHQHHSTVKF